MATTGTTNFNMDFLEIAEEAWERASGGTTELRSGYNLRTARRSLNLLLLDWANRGLNLWTMEEGFIPLVAGVGSYTLPADTVDIVEHRIRQGSLAYNPNTSADLVLARISMSTYATLPTVYQTGRPLQIFVDRQAQAPIARLWPVPDGSIEYTLIYWRLRRMQDTGSGIQTQDIPFRFLPAMTAGLAYMIAGKIPEGAPRIQLLKQQYDEAWILASDEDREKAPVRFVPRVARL